MFHSPPPLATLVAGLREVCDELDPALLSGTDVDRAIAEFAAVRKLADGALTRLAAKYERAGGWRERGATSGADDLARQTGTAPSATKRQIDASKELAERPGLDAAVKAGQLSTEQATTIAKAASTPEQEAELIEVARNESHQSLRDAAAKARAADGDADERRARIHRSRRATTWTDDDGAWNLRMTCLPEWGAEIEATLKPLFEEKFNEARRQGRRDPIAAYKADALFEALCGTTEAPTRRSGQAVRPDRKVVATLELAALHRGSLEGDETCHIAGVGPVSVAAARSLLGDATLALVIKDGVDIKSVTHLGRQVTSHQRTALEARDYVCEVLGCGANHDLEIDHLDEWALTHRTHIDELAWLCKAHHARKSRERLKLLGPPGRRQFAPSSSASTVDEQPQQDELVFS